MIFLGNLKINRNLPTNQKIWLNHPKWPIPTNHCLDSSYHPHIFHGFEGCQPLHSVHWQYRALRCGTQTNAAPLRRKPKWRQPWRWIMSWSLQRKAYCLSIWRFWNGTVHSVHPSRVNSQFGKSLGICTKKHCSPGSCVKVWHKKKWIILTERIFGQLVQSCLPPKCLRTTTRIPVLLDVMLPICL